MKTIGNIVVLGAGKMGSGIAQFFATKGHHVQLIYVHDDKTRWNPQQAMRDNLEILCRNDIVAEEEIPAILSRIRYLDRLEEAEQAELVIECIVEDLAVKQEYFRRMDAFFPEDVVLASNTSAISITEIGARSVHRERIIGTHFWDPPYLIPLVEIIRTEFVSAQTVERVRALMNTAGKRPVVVEKDVPGFLANRMQHALLREALSIVQNGIASPEDVDDSIRYGFGMRLGITAPVELIDRGGLDLTYNIHKYLFPHLEDAKEPLPTLTDHIEQGHLGFKTGEGFFHWNPQKIEQSNRDYLTGLIRVAKALGRV